MRVEGLNPREALLVKDCLKVDYSALDRPEVSRFIFYPRPEFRWNGFEAEAYAPTGFSAPNVLIPVEPGISIGARFHMAGKSARNILFFHGNGEIVADYDDLGPVYNRMGINFLAVDYRGYGRSTGQPSVSSMMRDCHAIFEFVKNWLEGGGYSGPLILMGRSLGSACVIELAACSNGRIDGLIVESGFAYAGPLLELVGIRLDRIGFKEEEGFRNIDKIRSVESPVLIMHGEYDQIIPFADAQALFDASPSSQKTLVKISGANHNDIFIRSLTAYMSAIKSFADAIKAS